MARRPSVMTHSFSQVPKADIPRSTFDRSHGHKTTFDAGYLIPILVDEALPGDTFQVNLTGFARLATPIFPIMDNMFMETQFFSVPVRLLWENWKRFNGEQVDPGDSTDYLIPQVYPPAEGYAVGSFADHIGLPTGPGQVGFSTSALFGRAYNMIYNEWYRDQNLQDHAPVGFTDGPDPHTNFTLRRRGKRHDYFTSCLPWPQKGPGVSIPIGGACSVESNGSVFQWSNDQGATNSNVFSDANGFLKTNNVGVGFNQMWGPYGNTGLYADLSTATAATINSLRQAFQVQKIFERDARGGTRYIEILKAHFGVTSPDARQQRPEYLGGGSSAINVSPVPQTSGTPTAAAGYTPTPQGNLAAVGTAVLNGHGFTASFTEHCIIIGLVSVRADLTYQQGINRMHSRRTRFDFYWPALSHIGEQAVLNKEIFVTGTPADNEVFGYQERYAEYRYKPSLVTGLFRSSAPGTLDAWHLSQQFAGLPALNEEFIVEDPPLDRVIAVPSEPHFLFDSYIRMKCTRPMPTYGVPGYIDHF